MALDWQAVMGCDYPWACHTIARLMPASIRGTFDAEDFVGDALVAVTKNPTIYQGRQTLIMIAKRRMIDVVRRPRSKRLRPELDRPDPSLPASRHAEDGETRQRLLARAHKASDRDTIGLLCDGCTRPEIAARTKTKLRTVQRQVRRLAREIAL